MNAIELALSPAFESHSLVPSFGGWSINELPGYYNLGGNSDTQAGERHKR